MSKSFMSSRMLLATAVLAFTLGLGACGGDSNDPDPDDNLDDEVSAVFPAGEARTEAEALADELATAANAGDMATAEARAFDLTELTMDEYYAGRLPSSLNTSPGPLDDLITDAFLLAGLEDPGTTPASFSDDGMVRVVRGTGGTFATPSAHAGIDIPSGSVPQTTLLVVTRLPDTQVYAPRGGPLPTTLDQYPLFYEFDFTPTVTLTADGIIGICQFDDTASPYYASDPVFARLQLAHPDPDAPSSVELLERVDAPFLDCATTAAMLRVPALMRTGGIGGRVRKFSPFAAVDPVAPAGPVRSTLKPMPADFVDAIGSQVVPGTLAQSVFDDFTLGEAASITSFDWQWSYCAPFNNAAAPAPNGTSFRITIFPNSGGLPDTTAAVFNQVYPAAQVAVTHLQDFNGLECTDGVRTGTNVAYSMYRHSVTFNTPFAASAGTRYWVRIIETAPSYDVVGGWLDGTNDNATAWVSAGSYFAITDRAFALYAEVLSQ